MSNGSFDIYTYASLVLVGLMFIYLGWTHRANLGQPKSGSLRKEVEPRFLIPSLFVVIGSGEIGLAITQLFKFGLGGISFLFGLAAAMFAIAVMMPYISEAVNRYTFTRLSYNGYHSYTTPDFIFYRFGRGSSIGATAITAIAFWGILMLQFLVGGTIIAALTGAPIGLGVLLMVLVVTVYTTLGGFSALYLTDLWQSILMWVALTITVFVLFWLHGSIDTFSTALDEFGEISGKNLMQPTVIALFFVTLIAAFGGPDLWQRANMASSPKLSLVVAGIGVTLFAILIAAFSVDIQAVLSTQAKVQEGNELTQYLSLVVFSGAAGIPVDFVWPDWLRIIVAVGFLSAFISTADTSAMLVATSIQNEINRLGDKDIIVANEKNTQIIIVISCISAALASLFATDLAAAFTAILGILGVLGLPTFLGLLGRGNSTTCLFALILGTIILVVQAYFIPQIYNDGWWLFLPMCPALPSIFVRT